MTLTATPHMDALACATFRAFPAGENVLAFPEVTDLEKPGMSGPALRPNDAALELFREMTVTLRNVEAGVAASREELAEIRGAQIPAHVSEQGAELKTHHDRLLALENASANAAAASRPFWFVVREAGKTIIAALVGAAAVLATGKPHP